MDTYSSHPKTNQGINDIKQNFTVVMINSQIKSHSNEPIAHDNTVTHHPNHLPVITL